MGLLLNGTPVNQPLHGAKPDGTPETLNALYDDVMVWKPAAETLTGVILTPDGFTVQPLGADHPTVTVKPQAVYADGHTADAPAVLSSTDEATATVSYGGVKYGVQDMLVYLVLPEKWDSVTLYYTPEGGTKQSVHMAKLTDTVWRTVLPDCANGGVEVKWKKQSEQESAARGPLTVTGRLAVIDGKALASSTSVPVVDTATIEWASDTTTMPNALKNNAYDTARLQTTVDGRTWTASIHVGADEPDNATSHMLWCRTERTHNNLAYYTGSYDGDNSNSMCFLIDRIREIWRMQSGEWKLLTGKELE